METQSESREMGRLVLKTRSKRGGNAGDDLLPALALLLAAFLCAALIIWLGAAPARAASVTEPADPASASPTSLPWRKWQLYDPSGAATDSFGHAVAISGDTAVVGSIWDDIDASTDEGSAQVFCREGLTWTRQALLTGSDCGSYSHFGISVAISGDTIVVGAPDYGSGLHLYQGAAYVFTRSGTTWTQQARLTASDAGPLDYFGISVAISGDRIVVGATGWDSACQDVGQAYFFRRNGSTWTQQYSTSAPSGGGEFHNFGNAVAISGSTAVVGAEGDDVGSATEAGSAWAFTGLTDSGYAYATRLTASDGAAGDSFGHSVAVSGSTALVGAYEADPAGADSGAAYVFAQSGSSWTQQAELTARDGAAGDNFGQSVAIAGNQALVGAHYDNGAYEGQGSASVFTYHGGWREWQYELSSAAAHEQGGFGDSVALSDAGLAVVGAPFEDSGGAVNRGYAYVINCCDDVAPTTTATATGGVSTWTRDNVTFELRATDEMSGVDMTYFRYGTNGTFTYWDPRITRGVNAEGATTIQYYSHDIAGNTEGIGSMVIKIDRTAPTTTASGVPDGWSKDPVIVAFNASDALSGMTGGEAKTQYSYDDGTAWHTGESVTVSTEGTTTLVYRSIDAAGNIEATKSLQVRIDKATPSTSVSGIPAGWSRGPVTATFAATDGLSGMAGGRARTEYSTDGGASWAVGTSAAVAREGATSLLYRSVDLAGNAETAKSVEVKIDSVGPTTRAYAAGVKKGKKVRLGYRVNDSMPGCGAATVRLKIFKGARVVKQLTVSGTVLCNVKQSCSWRCTLGKGKYAVKVFATDAAGNVQSSIGKAPLTVK